MNGLGNEFVIIDNLNLDHEIEKGNFINLFKWLNTNIHQKASFFSTSEILEQVTNNTLNAKYFKEYINDRYLKY